MPASPSSAPLSQFDTAHFRQALSQFATGVTVVTARLPDGTLAGVTINSFNAVSLAPPLVLWSLAHDSGCMAVFARADSYVINVLAGDQIELAQRFARKGEDRFEHTHFSLTANGQPRLAGTVAWFECRQRSRYDEGDHAIFVAEVAACHFHPHRTLGFHRGRFIAIS